MGSHLVLRHRYIIIIQTLLTTGTVCQKLYVGYLMLHVPTYERGTLKNTIFQYVASDLNFYNFLYVLSLTALSNLSQGTGPC